MNQRLTPLILSQAQIEKAQHGARRVELVFDNSPAQALGVAAGWLILSVNGEKPTASRIRDARLRGVHALQFFNPENSEAWTLENSGTEQGLWPHGLFSLPKADEALQQSIRINRYDVQDMHNLWELGNWAEFAQLREAFESAILPGPSALFRKFRNTSRIDAKIFSSSDFASLGFLALAYLAQGDRARAQLALEAAETARGNQPYIPSYFALLGFVKTLCLFQEGEVAAAQRLGEETARAYPQCHGVQRLFGTLIGKPGAAYVHAQLNKPFAPRYELVQKDPFGIWPDGDETAPPVLLQDELDNMAEDQLLIIYALSHYRTNGPLQVELVSLAGLFAMAPERIAAIHVISSYDQDPEESYWLTRNAVEHDVRKRNLPLKVLQDPGDSLLEDLAVSFVPAVFVLDKSGTVISTGRMADEEGYWSAMTRLAHDGRL